MTPDILSAATGITPARAAAWADPLSAAMALYAIDSPARQAAFLAQIAHESGGFVWTTELWGPTATQRGYDARADLGNTVPAAIRIAAEHGSTPGPWWKGRGLIQLTGYSNFRACGEALNLNLLDQPELLAQPTGAALSAAWFWNARALNVLADSGDFATLTKRVNGGLNGRAERQALWVKAKAALGVTAA